MNQPTNPALPRVTQACLMELTTKKLYQGSNHGDIAVRLVQNNGISPNQLKARFVEGFIDEAGKFLTREEAHARFIACGQGQPKHPTQLYSYDL